MCLIDDRTGYVDIVIVKSMSRYRFPFLETFIDEGAHWLEKFIVTVTNIH